MGPAEASGTPGDPPTGTLPRCLRRGGTGRFRGTLWEPLTPLPGAAKGLAWGLPSSAERVVWFESLLRRKGDEN